MEDNNVSNFPGRQIPNQNGGNGNGIDGRLRSLEDRLARVETDMKHLATRAWVLGGVVGGMGAAAGITLLIIRLFPQ